MTVGIYCITNLENNKKYIGQSIDIEERFKSHKKQLRGNRHHNIHLQSSYNMYGMDALKFEILCECTADELDEMEIKFINEFNAINREFGYNLVSGGNRKKIYSLESRRKMSLAKKGKYLGENNPNYGKRGKDSIWYGRKHSKESLKKMSESQKGHPVSEETRKKISKSLSGANNPNYGKKMSEENKQKISKALKGKYTGENHWHYGKRGKDAYAYGRKHTEETKKLISEKLKGKTQPRGKDAYWYGRKHTEETKKKISESKIGTKYELQRVIEMSKKSSNTGFFRVRKKSGKKYAKGFIYRYTYTENNKQKTISSVDIAKLEQKVKEKGFLWINFNEVSDEELENMISNHSEQFQNKTSR